MKPKATFVITTLGCKVNQCESDAISRSLEAEGTATEAAGSGPDICIINTCTVTQKASMQSRQAIRKAIRTYPEARIIVTGCYAQTAPQELAEIDGVTAVIGNTDKMELPQLLARSDSDDTAGPTIVHHKISNAKHFAVPAFSAHGARTRPFLKIQDGCNAFCTYCIVPYARGRSRSMPFNQVLEQLEALNRQGFLETVLTGIHLGCYGQDLNPPTTFYRLLETIERNPPLPRIRLSSIEPMELSDDIIALVADSKTFCCHFHIPLQSGDNTILKLMQRPYTREDFAKKVHSIHQRIPGAAIGADVLVGFPGESDQAFENTLSLIQSLPVSYLHVFPFSPRKNTPAYSFSDKVPERVTKERCKVLRELGQTKKRDFFTQQIGKTVAVLLEGTCDRTTGKAKGLSGNYLPVQVDAHSKNCIVQVLITHVTSDLKLLGKIQPADR